jgi:hypothetical protein
MGTRAPHGGPLTIGSSMLKGTGMALLEGTGLKAILVSASWLTWLLGLAFSICGRRSARKARP